MGQLRVSALEDCITYYESNMEVLLKKHSHGLFVCVCMHVSYVCVCVHVRYVCVHKCKLCVCVHVRYVCVCVCM